MPFAVKVEGTKELRRAIRQLEDAADRKGANAELRSAWRTAARVVESRAKVEAPRRSGALAGSIKSKATTRGASVSAGGTKRVPYAGPIHYGWGSRPNKRKGWRGGPIAANRFLDRAVAESIDPVVAVLEDGMRRLVDKVFD